MKKSRFSEEQIIAILKDQETRILAIAAVLEAGGDAVVRGGIGQRDRHFAR